MRGSIVGLALVAALIAPAPPASAQSFAGPAATDAAGLPNAMPALARQVLAAYRNDDPRAALEDLFRLDEVAGRHADAVQALEQLQGLLPAEATPRIRAFDIEYRLYARARARSSEPFEAAYGQAFAETVSKADDRSAASLLNRLDGPDVTGAHRELQSSLAALKAKASIPLADALKLVRAYYEAEVADATAPLLATLVPAEDVRRWAVEKDIRITAPDGATLCALVVRPRSAPQHAPAAFEFTIYNDPSALMREARRSAGYGYVGVEGLTRGKGCSPDQPVPYEHDGADADAVIDWIAAQPWSDGQVGMFGGSYSGGTGWMALKHPPKALKVVDVGAPVSPGIDVPMEGDVTWMFVYAWPFYTLNNKTLDNATYADFPHWQKLQRDWYVSGRAFRDLDKIEGTPNPIWDRWLAHPTYDAYWQAMVPAGDEFANIHIPVLQTAGYFYGGPGAAVWYLEQHYAHDAKAQSYLVIGPFEHFQGQRGNLGAAGGDPDQLAGLTLDPSAHVDLVDLRYTFFDHVMKGAPMPALLGDKVNYEVPGANVWKHAPSLAAMGPDRLRLHLSGKATRGVYRLSDATPSGAAAASLTVKLADRSDVDALPIGGAVVDTAIDTRDTLEFVSIPLPRAMEASGLFSGHLDFVVNKKDVDLEIDLYEETPDGKYVQLAPWWMRMSQLGDLEHRRLLTPGKRTRADFRSIRLMSRQMQAGSRIVAVIYPIKQSGRQINFGSGKTVSDETVADAGPPLSIRFYPSSFIDVPVAK